MMRFTLTFQNSACADGSVVSSVPASSGQCHAIVDAHARSRPGLELAWNQVRPLMMIKALT